jgi:hypothetical protein
MELGGDIVLALSNHPSINLPLCPISFPHNFSATTGWNSTKLNGKHQYKKVMRDRRLDLVKSFNTELWPLMGYALYI